MGEDKFQQLKSDLVRVLTIGLTAIAIIIALEGLFIASIMTEQKELSRDINGIEKKAIETDGEIRDVKRDVGTLLVITPKDKYTSPVYYQLLEKYQKYVKF